MLLHFQENKYYLLLLILFTIFIHSLHIYTSSTYLTSINNSIYIYLFISCYLNLIFLYFICNKRDFEKQNFLQNSNTKIVNVKKENILRKENQENSEE